MASDMMVALARATADGRAFFGHNSNRPRGEGCSLVRTPGRHFAPGEVLALARTRVPQVRHTWTVVAGRADRKSVV